VLDIKPQSFSNTKGLPDPGGVSVGTSSKAEKSIHVMDLFLLK
jgi:hypothetical protein